MPQFDTHFFTPLLFWSAVSFAILLFLLKRYAFPAITENLAKAERARQEAERLLAEYQAKLKSAQQEATAMIDQARKQALQVGEDNQRRVKEETDRMLATAREEMARERLRMGKELKEQTVELVMAASERILRRSLTDADHTRLIKEAIEQLS